MSHQYKTIPRQSEDVLNVSCAGWDSLCFHISMVKAIFDYEVTIFKYLVHNWGQLLIDLLNSDATNSSR